MHNVAQFAFIRVVTVDSYNSRELFVTVQTTFCPRGSCREHAFWALLLSTIVEHVCTALLHSHGMQRCRVRIPCECELCILITSGQHVMMFSQDGGTFNVLGTQVLDDHN